MVRNQFFKQLEELNKQLLKMGEKVQNIVEQSVEALKNQDLILAKKVLQIDDEIDLLEHEIEQQCIHLIALQQPIAKDLRVIATVLKIITDLERIGDHAVNIANVTLDIGKEPFVKPLLDLPRMAKLSIEMVKKSLNSFMLLDVEMARGVSYDDAEVDNLYLKIINDLIQRMVEEKETISQATKLMFIARYLERIADYATNIGERVVYIKTGVNEEIN